MARPQEDRTLVRRKKVGGGLAADAGEATKVETVGTKVEATKVGATTVKGKLSVDPQSRTDSCSTGSLGDDPQIRTSPPNDPRVAAFVLGLLSLGMVAMVAMIAHIIFMGTSPAAEDPPNVNRWNPKLDDPFEDGGGIFSGKELKEMLKKK